MDNKEEIQKILETKIKPYEEKIESLEKLAETKNVEIQKLKQFIYDFHKVLEEINQMDLPA